MRFLGGYLSEKTGADIKVGRIAVTPDFRVFVDDVSVKDLNDNNLAKIGKLRTKIHVGDLLDGKIHLGHVELSNTEANLIKYEGTKDFNFKFLVDFFKTDKEKDPNKETMPLVIDRISLKNVDFQFWNQNKADSTKTARHTMDYAHLDLDNINLEARHFSLVGDSVYAVVEMLRAKEISGLELKHFQSDVVVCQKGIFLNDMQMETNNSLFHADLNMKYNSYKAFSSFVDSVFFDANIYPTDVLLSDIGYFASVMYKMPDQVFFKGRFSGPIRNFSVKDMDASFGKMTNIKGDLSMHPLDFFNGEHVLNVKSVRFSYDDLANFHIPGKSGTIPLPASLEVLKSGNAKVYFKGSYNNFNSEITLVSDIGDVQASIARNNNVIEGNVFSGFVDAHSVNAGLLANVSKIVGKLDLTADFKASFPKDGNPDFNLDGKANNVELLGNRIDEIVLNGDMQENRFKGKVNVDDDELQMDFNGLIDFSNAKRPKSDFKAVIRHADLYSLNLLKVDTLSQLSTRVYVDMTGFDIDNLEGVLRIDSTLYRDSRGSYIMRSFDASIVNDNLMQRRINMDCDFFNFQMGGQINFASLMMSLNEYGDYFVHFPIWEENMKAFEEYKLTHNVDQDFFVQLNLKDTKTLSRLLMPSLEIARNTSVNATFTSRARQLNLTARTKSVQLGPTCFRDLELRNFNSRNAAYASLSLGEVAWTKLTETDTMNFGLDNIVLFAKMANDTISTHINWDDVSDEDHNKTSIQTSFHPHKSGGTISIDAAEICINDTLWQVTPNNYIDIDSGRVMISNVKFFHNQQSLALEGYVPMGEEDTLTLQFNRFDISMFDILTYYWGFNMDGFISGNAHLGNLKEEPMILADLNIDRLGVNGDNIGDANLKSRWNNAEQSVEVDMSIKTGNVQNLSVLGTYYTKRVEENLDFTVFMDSLRLAIITPFVAGQVSRIQGFGNGNITVKGSTKQPRLEGTLSVRDGGCKITYLNTFYTFNPTILMDSKTIEFKDMVLVDTLGNKASVEGKIYHNFLKDFNLDFKLYPRDFLVMSTTIKDNDSFYGNIIANGLVTIKGPFSDIMLDVKARTRKATNLVLPLNRASTVRNSDFIVFVNNEEEEEEEEVVMETKKKDFAINIDADVTDDASVKIFLPGDIGTIEAKGHGNLKVGTTKTEPLTLYGNYIINNGRFQLNFKDILYKNFTLKPGGTISWAGSPTDGRIDATGVYSVKTSLASLGVQVDSTATGNGAVNVECLIHLKDALLNPSITFGLNLPNASEDVTQTVFSLIDTTNQAVMSTQALSLLVLGSFSNAGNSDGASGTSAIDALANNLFGGMSFELSKDVDLGFRYQSITNSYDELQIAMKTELFENRLIIETNFGVVTGNTATENASNLIGEVDLYYKLIKDGRLMAHFYNHSNYNTNYSSFSYDRLAPYTQGLGLSYSMSFDSFRDLFKRKKSATPGRPLMNRTTNTNKEAKNP